MAAHLVTGCSSGIGRGIVQELVRRGHRVWGLARRAELLKELSLQAPPGLFHYSVCDVSRKEEVRETVQEMDRVGFDPDVVILNAGINPEANGLPFTIENFEEVMKTNLLGALIWVDIFLPRFRTRGFGQFVAISSLAAYRGDARWIAYCASKAALSRAFEAFRGRHAREGITFSTIHLGAVETGMGEASRSPWRLSVDEAARKILSKMERRVESVTIPAYLRAILEFAQVLPDRLFSRLIAGAFGKLPLKKP